MKYLKIYETYWEDYRIKKDNLENEYRPKIEGSLIHLLDRLEKIKEKYDDESYPNQIIDLTIGDGTFITNDENLFETSDAEISIYSKIFKSDWLIFEKSHEGEWGVIYMEQPYTLIKHCSTYDLSNCIDNLLKNFSGILNKDVFFKINK